MACEFASDCRAFCQIWNLFPYYQSHITNFHSNTVPYYRHQFGKKHQYISDSAVVGIYSFLRNTRHLKSVCVINYAIRVLIIKLRNTRTPSLTYLTFSYIKNFFNQHVFYQVPNFSMKQESSIYQRSMCMINLQ